MSDVRLTESEESLLWSAAIDQGTMLALARACERILAARLADRDAAGVETRVREIADFCAAKEADFEASYRTDGNAYAEAASDWLGLIEERLRAALSGPADAHPADGTST